MELDGYLPALRRAVHLHVRLHVEASCYAALVVARPGLCSYNNRCA